MRFEERRSQFVGRLVHGLRQTDDWLRTVGNWFAGTDVVARFGQRSLLAFLLPIPVLIFAVYGPVLFSPNRPYAGRGWPALLIVSLATCTQLLYFLYAGSAKPRESGTLRWLRMRHVHFVLILSCTVASWLWAEPEARAAGRGLYHHYYGWLATSTVGVATLLAPWIARRRMFCVPARATDEFARAFVPAAVVAPGTPPPVTWVDIGRAALTTALQTPLHVLAPVALAAVAAPAQSLHLVTLVCLAASFSLVLIGNYDGSRDAFVRWIGRNFLSGTSLVLTIVVLILAGLRLVGVSYVTTVLDAGRAWVIYSYLFSTYSLLWLCDFWMHQAGMDCVLDLQHEKAFDECIRRHGGGRLKVSSRGLERAFEPAALLRRIAEVSGEQRERLRALADQARTRFTVFASVMTALMLCAGYITWRAAAVSTELPHTGDRAGAPVFDLKAKLAAARGQTEPILLFAASGGGTRAALYAAAALHGIQRLGKLERVAVVSGVSGGSAATAYFAAFRGRLVHGGPDAWERMLETLRAPYIQDVLAGAGEWRIVGRTRLGQLLTESFGRSFDAAAREMGEVPRSRQTGDVKDIGVMFNAALCGEGRSAEHGGGFAVITNMQGNLHSVLTSSAGWTLSLPIVRVARPTVSLAEAVSLSANFPPIFSNALLYTDYGASKLWVTDGGAVENRGVIQLLLALLDALRRLDADGAPVELPPIRIVVAEASALDDGYRSDRGLGAKFGAATQLANGFINVLLERANEAFRRVTRSDTDGVRLVYLPMPDALRARGTFGTHWMMPPKVPLGVPEVGENPLELKDVLAVQLIDALFEQSLTPAIVRDKWGKLWPELDPAEVVRRLVKPGEPSLFEILARGIASEPRGSARSSRGTTPDP